MATNFSWFDGYFFSFHFRLFWPLPFHIFVLILKSSEIINAQVCRSFFNWINVLKKKRQKVFIITLGCRIRFDFNLPKPALLYRYLFLYRNQRFGRLRATHCHRTSNRRSVSRSRWLSIPCEWNSSRSFLSKSIDWKKYNLHLSLSLLVNLNLSGIY